ncbi:MAG: hypothetical protein RL026_936 [Pseudomonadota bacterium]
MDEQALREASRIVFPCDYPVKVVANAADGLRAQLDAVFVAVCGGEGAARVSLRASGQARYVAYTYTIVAQGPEQLAALHAALKGVPGVVMVL